MISGFTWVGYKNNMKNIWYNMSKVSIIYENKCGGYIFAKSENHELEVNNSFIVWRPMSLPEDRSQGTGKSQVANVCGINGVKGAGLIILEGIRFILPQEPDEVSTAFIP